MKNDEDLLIAARDGDEDAFTDLVNRNLEPLTRFLAGRYGESKADDVAQIAWLKVSQRMGDYREGQPFKPWLYSIASNAAKDALKAEARFQARIEDFAKPLEWEEPESVADNEDRQRALALLKSLPKSQREAIYWTALHGSSRAAGRLLGPTHPTIQKRIQTGLAAIQGRLHEGDVGTATIEEIRSLAISDLVDDLSPEAFQALERLWSGTGKPEDASEADKAFFRDFVYRLVGE